MRTVKRLPKIFTLAFAQIKSSWVMTFLESICAWSVAGGIWHSKLLIIDHIESNSPKTKIDFFPGRVGQCGSSSSGLEHSVYLSIICLQPPVTDKPSLKPLQSIHLASCPLPFAPALLFNTSIYPDIEKLLYDYLAKTHYFKCLKPKSLQCIPATNTIVFCKIHPCVQ